MFMRTVLKASIGRFMKVSVATGEHCVGRELFKTVPENEIKKEHWKCHDCMGAK